MIAYTNLLERGEEDLIELVDSVFESYDGDPCTAPEGFTVWACEELDATLEELRGGEFVRLAREVLYTADSAARVADDERYEQLRQIDGEVARAWLEFTQDKLIEECERYQADMGGMA